MSNPFQDQLLKTGLVSKKQAHKARQNKSKQQHSKNSNVTDETKIKVQRAAEHKAKRDRELNKKRVEQMPYPYYILFE